MRKSEFLKELEAALNGEIPAAAVSENLRYYDNYISQETAKGRSEAEVIEEIGSPRLIAKTIIDSSEAAGSREGQGGYGYSSQGGFDGDFGGSGEYGSGYGAGYDTNYGEQRENRSGFHYVNLNKWYWKFLVIGILVLVLFTILSIVGGIFALLFRYATPILIILLIWSLIRNSRRR